MFKINTPQRQYQRSRLKYRGITLTLDVDDLKSP